MRLPAPEGPLEDDVVTLRPWQIDDAPAIMAAIDGDPAITEWLDLIPQPYGLGDARDFLALARRDWVDGTGATFAVLEAQADQLAGSVGARLLDPANAVAEVGYWTARDARSRGLATRALQLVAGWLFDAGIERLQLQADVQNEASQRVAEKAGFTREGVLRSYRYNERRRRRVDFVLFSLLHDELR
jgi:RimJ/RimL family protein N-acetyltransferase